MDQQQIVAFMYLRDGAVKVEIEDSEIRKLTEVVYAWMTETEPKIWVRGNVKRHGSRTTARL
jgi:hypothetical protein